MIIDQQVIAFMGIAALLTIAPGPDTMLVIRNVMAHGQRTGFLTALGICCGLFVHATLSAAGLSLILVRSATAYEVVKLLGAAYLIWLGVQSLWRAFHRSNREIGNPISQQRSSAGWPCFVQGFLTNILNPKVAVFYLALLPQFISAGDWVFGKSMLLALIHWWEGILWLSMVTLFFGHFQAWFSQSHVKSKIDATIGAVLVAFGTRLAMEQR
jgi:RhtB (resistance to homoserine/threonine) family protein